MGNYAGINITSSQGSANLGRQVSDIGDFNGDGIDDFLVSAPYGEVYGDDYVGSGVTFVVFGSDDQEAVLDLLSSDGLPGEIDGSNGFALVAGDGTSEDFGNDARFRNVGRFAAGLGDVNGDGFADIAVGGNGYYYANYYDGYAVTQNFLYVVFGSGAERDAVEAVSEQPGALSIGGMSGRLNGLASAGDVDGDGRNDLIISQVPQGSGFYGEFGSSYGREIGYVLFGDEVLDAAPNGEIRMFELDGSNGFAVLGLNSDGGGSGGGFYGDGPISIDGQAFAYGHDIVSLGDVNGDGFGDLLIRSTGVYSSYYDDPVSEQRTYYTSIDTRGFIFFGRDSDDQAPSVDVDSYFGGGDVVEVNWPDVTGGAGYSGYYGNYYSYDVADGAVAGIGDFNGDGYDDVAVSAPSLFAVGSDGDPDRFEPVNGGVYVLFGGVDGPQTFYNLRPGEAMDADLTLIDTSEGADRFGAVLAGAGDVNGDGFDDFLIGQRGDGYYGDGYFVGDASLYLVFGGNDFDPSTAIDLSTETEGAAGLGDRAYRFDGANYPADLFRPGGFFDTGFLSTAGDVNGDGFADIVLGAPFDGTGEGRFSNAEGRAFVIYGGEALEAADTADGFDDNVIDLANLTVDVETGAVPINVGLQGPGAILEGNVGPTVFTFTIRRTGDLTADVSVDWAVSAAGIGSATADDFVGGTFPSGTATFASGQDTAGISVEVQGDLTIEGNEPFALTISNLSIPESERGDIVGSPTAVATILNDDRRVEITIQNNASGFEDDGPITVDIIRSGNTDVEVTANYAFTSFDVEADDLEQPLPITGSVTFLPGETRIPIEINPSADPDIEPDEFLQGLITSAALSGADAGGDTPVDIQSDFPSFVRIRNDDAAIILRPGSASVEEGGDLVFSIFRSGDVDGEVEVFWEATPSSFRAAGDADIDGGLPQSGSVVFADGDTSKTVTLATLEDLVVEGTEYVDFRLTGSNASGPVDLSTFPTRGTIRDNDFNIDVRVSNAYATEDGGELRFVFTRSGELGADVTVDYAITPGTAGAAANADDLIGGLNQTGQVSFAADDTSKEIFVPIRTDSEVEPLESVDITLTGGSTTSGFNVVLQQAPSRGYIYNDDFFINLGVSARSASEGSDLVYTITRSGDTGAEVTVEYRFDSPTGVYEAESADVTGGLPQGDSVTFLAGETSKTIRLGTVEDDELENDEVVEITLDRAFSTGSNQITGLGSTATAAIRNDDFPVFFSASGGSVREDDGPLTFAVVRSGNTAVAASVDYSFSQYPFFPAATPDDIVGGLPQSGTIDFAAGEIRKTVQITPVVDFEEEPTETVQLTLTAASAADGSATVIQTSQAFGRIINDDLPPSISITGGGGYFEGTGGLTPVVFTFTRTGDLEDRVTVQFDLPRGTADQSDVDTFLPAFGRTVVFEPGESVVTDVVNIIADGIIELNETFGFQVTSVVSTDPAKEYDLFGSSQGITIINDDGNPPVPPPLRAPLFGDPHIVTLDGLNYSFMAVGEFVLVESTPGASDPFQVQVRFEPAPGSSLVSVTTRMAVEVGDHVVEIDALGDEPLLIDGAATAIDLGLGSVDIDGDGTPDVYLQQDGGRTTYTIILNETGEQLEVGMFDGYINVSVSLQNERAGAVRGLMGDADGETDNDIAGRDGSTFTQPVPFEQLYGDYAASWRLDASNAGTDKASLFTYATGEDTGAFTDLAFPAGVVDLDDVPQALIDEAEAAATEAGITDPILREAAILDFVFTGDPSFLEGASELPTEPDGTLEVGDAPEIPLTVNVSGEPNSIVEGDDGAQTATFTFYRTGPATNAVTVSYVVEGVDAADLAPGTALSGTVLIGTDETETTLEIDILGDLSNEADETLTVRIASVSDGVIGGATGRTLILNDDLDPIAAGDAFTVGEDETIENNTLFGASPEGEADEDPDGDTLTIASVNGEELGDDGEATLALEFGEVTVRADGSFDYDPSDATADGLEDNEVETERFSYVVTDGNGGFDEAEVEIAIIGEDDGPLSNTVSVTADLPTVEEGDTPGQLVTFTVLREAANDRSLQTAVTLAVSLGGDMDAADGVSLVDTEVSFEPGQTEATITVNYTGDLTNEDDEDITVTIFSDEPGVTVEAASATTTVLTDDTPPDLVDDEFEIAANVSLTGSLLAANPTDPDSDAQDDTITVTRIIDSNGDSRAAAGPTSPIILPSGARLFVSADGSFTFNPFNFLVGIGSDGVTDWDELGADEFGMETFQYVAEDGNGGESIATVDITVIGLDDAPVTVIDEVSTSEDGPAAPGNVIEGTIAPDFDPEGGTLDVVAIIENGVRFAIDPEDGLERDLDAGGTLTINAAGAFLFDPDGDFEDLGDRDGQISSRQPSVTYVVADEAGNESQQSLLFSIQGVNDAPTAVGDEATTGFQTAVTVDVLDNDDDAEGDDLSVSELIQPDEAVGEVEVDSDDNVVFTPADGFAGVARFGYAVSDGAEESFAEVSVTVGGPGDRTFTIDPASLSVREEDPGDPGVTTVSFFLRRAGDLRVIDEVAFRSREDTASASSDFFDFDLVEGDGFGSSAATFSAGVEAIEFSAQIDRDEVIEAVERFFFDFRISSAFDNFTVDAAAAPDGSDFDFTLPVDIIDDDSAVEVSSPSALESEGSITFTITRQGDLSAEAFGVDLVGGTATSPDDFNGEVQFLPIEFGEGQAETTFTVDIVEDDVVEEDETFSLQLLDDFGAQVAIGTATILNDDVEIAVDSPEAFEADGSVTFTITRTGALAAADYNFELFEGSATSPEDFMVPGQVLPIQFGEGQAETTFTVDIVEDDVVEDDETFALALIDDAGAQIAAGTATILNDDVVANTAPRAVDDGPFAATEGAATGPLDVLANDSDPEGDALSIVGSDAFTVLGGRVVVAEDRASLSVDYAEVDLADLAEGDTRADSFQYAVSDGDLVSGATVSIEIEGVDDGDPRPVIEGTGGNDRLFGTEADEIFRPLSGAMDISTGGGGDDLFDFSASTANGVRETRYVLDFSEGDMIDIGDAQVESHRVSGGRLFLFLDGDRDTVILNGATEFDDGYFA